MQCNVTSLPERNETRASLFLSIELLSASVSFIQSFFHFVITFHRKIKTKIFFSPHSDHLFDRSVWTTMTCIKFIFLVRTYKNEQQKSAILFLSYSAKYIVMLHCICLYISTTLHFFFCRFCANE